MPEKSDRDPGISECELNIARALRDAPLIKLMVKALRRSGCELNPARHLVCENCSPQVEGTANSQQKIDIHSFPRLQNFKVCTVYH